MTKKRVSRIVAAGVMAVGIAGMSAGASAFAATSGSKTLGDCSLNVRLATLPDVAWPNGVKVWAEGNVYCTHRHPSTQVRVQLKVDSQLFYESDATWLNSFGTGSRWISSGNYWAAPGDCRVYQAVVIADIAGLGSAYATTGAPWATC